MPRLLRALVVACLLAATASPAPAGELSPEEQRWVKDLVAALSANSPRVRKGAEESLAKMGVDAIPAIADLLPTIKSEAALKGLKRALEGMGKPDVLAACARLAEAASTRAAGKRFEDVAALVTGSPGAAGAPGVAAEGAAPESVPLAPARLDEWTLAPLAAERPVRDRLSSDLLPGANSVSVANGALSVDADGDGKPEVTIPAGAEKVVEFGPADRRVPLLLYAKGAGWFACPAAIVRGGKGATAVEILDADSDGEFGGANDFVRVGDGAFGLVGSDRRILVGEDVVAMRVVHETAGLRLALTKEPPPAGADPVALEGLSALNRWRTALGLPPARLDVGKSDGCRKHAVYLQKNAGTPEVAGLGAHREFEGKPGYTTEGAVAAGTTIVSGAGDPAAAIAQWRGTMLHGRDLLGNPSGGFGIGAVVGRGGFVVLWGAQPALYGARAPLVVPAPGQRRVPTRGNPEEPPPVRPPNWYAAARGFPVTVCHAGTGLSDVNVHLALADGKTPVAGQAWNDASPIVEGFGSGTAWFMPAAPLEPKKAYVATVTARSSSGDPVTFVWSFRTD